MSNVSYQFEEKGMGIGILPDGTRFLFDGECFGKIKDMNWYRNKRGREEKNVYIVNQKGEMLHSYLLECPTGYEIDHINLDTFDNRSSNLRICIHAGAAGMDQGFRGGKMQTLCGFVNL